jgi:uncharacterized protein
MKIDLSIYKDRIAQFCKKHHILKLSLFGSLLHNNFTTGSDIDFLVEFDPEHIPGLIRLAGMEIELSQLLGYPVDMRTPNDLSKYFRDEVIRESEVQYAEG